MCKMLKEQAVSAAFMQYLAGTSEFESWKEHKETFKSLNVCDQIVSVQLAEPIMKSDNPLLVWQQFWSIPATAELADFVCLLLGIVVNQAGTEQTFSDLKIKKTQHRNRLKIDQLAKMSKVS